MNFFKSSSKTKTPPELIRSTREAIQRLDAASTGAEGRRKVSLDRLDVFCCPTERQGGRKELTDDHWVACSLDST